jgi:uncharacterized membrane protein YvbJ
MKMMIKISSMAVSSWMLCLAVIFGSYFSSESEEEVASVILLPRRDSRFG